MILVFLMLIFNSFFFHSPLWHLSRDAFRIQNLVWKILKEMGIPDYLTCLLKIYMQVRKQELELDMEQQTGSK